MELREDEEKLIQADVLLPLLRMALERDLNIVNKSKLKFRTQ